VKLKIAPPRRSTRATHQRQRKNLLHRPPATDIVRSADFYAKVFGWNVRQRGDGATSFDDGVGPVSGTWSLDRPPSTEPGLLLYIMRRSN
jgi:predicted enzyme related to lactoylglutathione lyase